MTYLKISSKMCRGRVSNTVNKNISLSICTISRAAFGDMMKKLCETENQGKDDIKPEKPRQSALHVKIKDDVENGQ
jgi:hypothetical protein